MKKIIFIILLLLVLATNVFAATLSYSAKSSIYFQTVYDTDLNRLDPTMVPMLEL